MENMEGGYIIIDPDKKREGEMIHIGEEFKNGLADKMEKCGMLEKIGCDKKAMRELLDLLPPVDIEDLMRGVDENKTEKKEEHPGGLH